MRERDFKLMIRMAEQLYLSRRQCTLSLTSNGSVLDGSLVSKAKGSFGSQWKFMKKDFNKKFVHEGRHEYHIMAILNTLDKAKNGDGGKHIVTVQNVPSRWQGGFAFQMPLALFSLADFQEDRSRVSGLTNGFILKSLVGGVEFLHKNNIAHGDIKPANVLVFSKDDVRLTDFGNSPYKVRGSASGTCGYRFPWQGEPIHIFCGDWWSLGLLFGGLFTQKRLLSDDAILGLGQKATSQARFWTWLELKLGRLASVYLPYLRPVLLRNARNMNPKLAAASLDSAADFMLELEGQRKSSGKRQLPALETQLSKRLKHQAPPVFETPTTPLSKKQRENQKRRQRHIRARQQTKVLKGA